MKLHSWAVKHDLDGDGLIIKTIHERGVGYDRPFDWDEMTLNLKIYQKLDDGTEKVYLKLENQDTVMNNEEHINKITKKLLQSMKTKE